MRKLFLLSLFVVLFLGISASCFAQGGAGELTGLVTDPTGAVMPKADVTLKNPATGAERKTQTTDAGIYRFPNLPIVGTYTLRVEAKGFKAFEAAGIVITVGTTSTHSSQVDRSNNARQHPTTRAESSPLPSLSPVHPPAYPDT